MFCVGAVAPGARTKERFSRAYKRATLTCDSVALADRLYPGSYNNIISTPYCIFSSRMNMPVRTNTQEKAQNGEQSFRYLGGLPCEQRPQYRMFLEAFRLVRVYSYHL